MLFNEARARQLMARDAIDAIVATSPENVMYATDYECITHWINKGFQVYSVYTPGHDPKASLIAPSLELEAIVDGRVWVQDCYLFSAFKRGPSQGLPMDRTSTAAQALVDRSPAVACALDGLVASLESRGLQAGRIAVDELGMTPFIFWELKQRLPRAEIVAGNALWWEIRMVKTADEIARLREASRITEAAIHHAYGLVRPGVRESDVVQAYHQRLTELGGRPTFMVLGSGTRTSYPHILKSDKVIEAGDIVRYDIGCTYDYYHSDTARAVVLGEPTAQQARLYEAMCTGVEDAIGLVKPGADVHDIYRAAMAPGKAIGLEAFDRFHCGHGIGIAVYDPPVVTLADPSKSAFLMPAVDGGLLPGMSLNIEVGYYVQGVMGFLCEDTLLVTDTGFERLTTHSKSLRHDRFMDENARH